MIENILEMFSYTFLVRAVIVGALVSICAALLGVSLVLKRYSMIGTGLSNVGFGSLAVAAAFNMAPLSLAIPVVIAAAFLLLRLSENSKIKGDAAVALVSTSSLAIGVIVISVTTGMNTDVCNYLFGSILAMSRADVYLSIALSITVLVLFILFYHKLFAITFDETFAKAGGINTGLYNMLIAFLTAITIVLGMRMMGAMLISSLIIFPALSSMRIFKQFKSVTVCSALISIICFFIGVVISYLYATPTGASVVGINIIVFVLFWFTEIVRNSALIKKRHYTAAIAIIAGLFFLTGCSRSGRTDTPRIQNLQGGIVEIRERMFIGQINEIYLNSKGYLGKTIKLEGIFKRSGGGVASYYVIRYGPGCCGDDGLVGFEVAGFSGRYPPDDSWVEATGVLKQHQSRNNLYLELSSLIVLNKRGAETVLQ